MNRGNDPVDKMFESLRAQSWPADSYDPELENRLMQEFNRRSNAPRLIRSRGFVIAAACLVLGGGTYAASSVILDLMHVTVEIDGETTEFDIASNGEASFRVDTADGGTADVTIQSTERADGEQMRRIDVTTTGGGAEGHEVAKVVKVCKKKGAGPEPADWEVLGDAEAVGHWTDTEGVYHELYVLAALNGGGSRVYMGVDPEGDAGQLYLLAEPPMDLTEFDLTVSLEDDGAIAIAADDGAGRELALKFRVDLSEDAQPDLLDKLQLGTPDGTIRIQVQDVGGND